MIWSGLVATLIKEALDLCTKNKWSWDDVVCGIAGWAMAFDKIIMFKKKN